MGRLEGKVAIVTGSTRGIGRGVAKLFAREGAHVVVCGRTAHEGEHQLPGSIDAAVEEIRAAGGSVIGVACDVSDEAQCHALVDATRAAFGPVDVLVNNAMWTSFAPVAELPLKRWQRSFAVNVQGPFLLSQLVLPEMIERRGGAIVNVSSNGAIGPGRGPYKGATDTWWDASGIPSATLYGATKAALERFTQGLAEEVYPFGVCVSCVAPSVGVATEGNVHFRLFTGPEDPRAEPLSMMADAILLLATAPLAHVTGRVTYSQAILKEFGWIESGRGFGIDEQGSGYSLI